MDYDPFADDVAPAPIAGASSPQPNRQPSSADNTFRNFSSPPSPGRFVGPNLPGSSLSPSTQGQWREANSHTLVFTPSGYGAPLGSQLRVQLPHAVAVTAGASGLRNTSQIEWTVPPGSTHH